MKYALKRVAQRDGNGTKRSRDAAMGIAAPVTRRMMLSHCQSRSKIR